MIRIIFPLIFSIATLVSGNAVAQQQPIQIAENAPDSYTIVRGDTLWSISGRFLKQPWRWPEVWKMNRGQIRNPHLIYPGQVVILDRSGPYLSIGKPVGTTSDKLSPRIYSEKNDTAIPSIPVAAIAPFLSYPLVIDNETSEEYGTVIGTDQDRLYTGLGDTIYAKNVDSSFDVWNVFRKSQPLIDPTTKERLGFEVAYLGTARVVEHSDEVTELEVLSATEEIGEGDQLIATEKPQIFAYVPHAPDFDVEGRIIGIQNGVLEAGTLSVVTLNVGSNDGIEVGHVLALHRYRAPVKIKKDKGVGSESFNLPEKRYGEVFVFRVFDRVSYALIMEAKGSAAMGDGIRKP